MALITLEDAEDDDVPNSFADAAYFQAYAAKKVGGLDILTAAEAESSNKIETALLNSVLFMNDEDWHGNVVDEDQPLAWYRRGVVRVNNGAAYYDQDVLPQQVKDAQCELGLGLLDDEQLLDEIDAAGGLTRFEAGPLKMEFKDGGQAQQAIRNYLRLTRGLVNRSGRTIR